MELHKIEKIDFPKDAYDILDVLYIKAHIPREPEKKYGPAGESFSLGKSLEYSINTSALKRYLECNDSPEDIGDIFRALSFFLEKIAETVEGGTKVL